MAENNELDIALKGVSDRQEALKNAEDAVKNAVDAVKSADDAVTAEALAVNGFTQNVFESDQTSYVKWNSQLDKANERLKEANERLKEARDHLKEVNERLEKAKDRLEKAYEHLNEAHERRKEAHERHMELKTLEVKRQRVDAMEKVPRSQWFPTDFKRVVTPASTSPFFTPLSGTTMTMEEWLEMAYNGNVLNLVQDKAQLEIEERRKLAGFQYFEMQFPILIHPSVGTKQRVFVRPCYETLFNLLLKNIRDGVPSVAITGNPGVGKSQFYAYCVFRLSKEEALIDGKTWIINKGNHYYAFADGNFEKLSVDKVSSYVHQKNVVRLIEGLSNEVLGWYGVTILFTSPGCPEYHEFLKANCEEYVMPPWSLAEMTIAASVVKIPVAEVQNRSSKFGGIARYVFARDLSIYESRITESIPNEKLLKLFGAVNIRKEVSEKDYSHRLLLMYPSHTGGVPYRGFFLNFASAEIADRLYKKVVDDSYEKLTEFVIANAEDSNSGGFRGTLFEIYCHRIWSSGARAQFKGRALFLNSQKDNLTVDVPDRVETFWFAKLTNLPVFSKGIKLYCRPIGKTFPCIDAIYWDGATCYLLQMTLSDRHDIVHEPLVKILDWCKWPIAFVFIVPNGKVEGYKQQNLVTSTGTVHKKPDIKARNLKQYVVGVKVIPLRR